MPEIWVVIHDDETIDAYDTQDAALNSARDDQAPYIECVTLNHAQNSPTRPPERPNPHTAAIPVTRPTNGPQRRWYSPPRLTIPDGFTVSDSTPHGRYEYDGPQDAA